MGVSWFSCDACGEMSSDHHEEVFWCALGDSDDSDDEDVKHGCGFKFCSSECGKPRLIDKTWTCVSCRGELTNDTNLLTFMLVLVGMTRAKAVKAYLKFEKEKRKKK